MRRPREKDSILSCPDTHLLKGAARAAFKRQCWHAACWLNVLAHLLAIRSRQTCVVSLHVELRVNTLRVA
eukprot:260167-Pyramimonas_sp.AAC.1